MVAAVVQGGSNQRLLPFGRDCKNRSDPFSVPLAIARGHRFGNFKPSAETVAALSQLMLGAGAPIPDDDPPSPSKGYAGPKKAVP